VKILWRPAYNLFNVKTENGLRKYSKPAGKRTDSTSGKFDCREAKAIEDFLNIARTVCK
jgi:hypothetical protein